MKRSKWPVPIPLGAPRCAPSRQRSGLSDSRNDQACVPFPGTPLERWFFNRLSLRLCLWLTTTGRDHVLVDFFVLATSRRLRGREPRPELVPRPKRIRRFLRPGVLARVTQRLRLRTPGFDEDPASPVVGRRGLECPHPDHGLFLWVAFLPPLRLSGVE